MELLWRLNRVLYSSLAPKSYIQKCANLNIDYAYGMTPQLVVQSARLSPRA